MNKKNKTSPKIIVLISSVFLLIFIVWVPNNRKKEDFNDQLDIEAVYDNFSSIEEVSMGEAESLMESSEGNSDPIGESSSKDEFFKSSESDISYDSISSEATESVVEPEEASADSNCSSNVISEPSDEIKQEDDYYSENKNSERSLVCLFQSPELPTGCEATSLTMILNFLGYNVSKTDIAKNYLPKSNNFYTYNGKNYGPDFRTTFPGNPFTNNGYGCFAPAIIKTANNYFSNNGNKEEVTVKDLSGCVPSVLYDYIDEGIPVIVWATMYMMSPSFGESWYTPSGDLLTWINHEHCLVLNGYDDKNVTLCDPLVGVTTYSRNLFETRFEQLGSQAIVITKN